MLFPWGRSARRQKLIRSPVPDLWEDTLQSHVPLYQLLPADLRKSLIGKARVMVSERIWAGSNGLELTEAMKIIVAAQAVILLAGDDGYLYERLPAIQLYPEYISSRPTRQNAHNTPHGKLLGDSWQSGNVRLSWPAVLAGAEDPQDGENVVIHEMAHHLDGLDGQMAGEPPLATESLQKKWPGVKAEFQNLVQAIMHHEWHWIDSYAGENPAEFFAVVTEAFFEVPAELEQHHPELFATFQELYRVDPRTWFELS
ncbi:zinc-dependent peptidase [Anatilimnocola sp. NA78]|uniref:M90 family metallopeptidase n=1 Tax=Anatilimnocola sp. NA78 TaxID=3415683 RepID=UPI003CE5780F